MPEDRRYGPIPKDRDRAFNDKTGEYLVRQDPWRVETPFSNRDKKSFYSGDDFVIQDDE